MKKIYFTLIALFIFNFAYNQCNSTVPANAVNVTQDSTIATNLGAGQIYLICEGVQLTYNGTQGAEVTYYLENGARMTSARQHNAIVYMKENSLFNAGYSQSTWAIISDIWYHPTATLVDTLAVAAGNMNECANVSFDYSLSGDCSGGGATNSIQEHSLNNISIHPNPANTTLSIDLASVELEELHIINVLGGIETSLQEINSSTITVDVSQFNAGTYFVRLVNKDGISQTRKLIITH
jgi:hypothetical protein